MQFLDCPGCGRNLLKYDMGALRPGKRITARCRDCKTISTLTGHADGLVGAADASGGEALVHETASPAPHAGA